MIVPHDEDEHLAPVNAKQEVVWKSGHFCSAAAI